jgi:hypothetical protein
VVPKIYGPVINLAAMETRRPLTVRASDPLFGALEPVPGAVVGNFLRDFYWAPECSLKTDLDVYSAVGLSSIELVHIGNPKNYHPAFDRGAIQADLFSAGRMLTKVIANYPVKKLFPVIPRYVSVGFTILGLAYGARWIASWVAFVIAIIIIGLVCAAFVGVAALMHFCNSVAFATSLGLWFVVLIAVGYALAVVGRRPLGPGRAHQSFCFRPVASGRT